MQFAVRPLRSFGGAVTLLAAFAAGCNGGSSAAPPLGNGHAATPSPSPSPAPLPASATATLSVGTSAASASLGPVLGGFNATIVMPPASAPATLTVALDATQPPGTPAVQTVKRRTRTIGSAGIVPVMFLTMTANVTVTFGATPAFSFVLPPGAASLGQIDYVALYDPTAAPQVGWTALEGPGTTSGDTIAFTGSSAQLQLKSGVTYDVALFSVTSALPTPSPSSVPTPTPTPTPLTTQAPSAQHLYTIGVRGTYAVIAEYGLPLTSSSTPIATVPAPVASGGSLGPFLAVNAGNVVYTDIFNREYFALKQPISSKSTPSAAFDGIAGCCNNFYTFMPIALSPLGELAGTESTGPISSPFLHLYASPFTNQTMSTTTLVLSSVGAGLAFDAAGNLFIGGSSTPSNGVIQEYNGNRLTTLLNINDVFITGVAMNANELAVAGVKQQSSGFDAPEVLVYALPLTLSSVPLATITNGVAGNFAALDAAGNLYVSSVSGGLGVYAAPLSNTSSPTNFGNLGIAGQVVIGP